MGARSIFLVGFAGTGKSTVARRVAALRGGAAVDLDERIAQAAGLAIPEIFAREGEPAFRDRETAALRDLPPGALVVATGGGAPLREENRRLMAARGWIVALEARPETLRDRVEAQRRRGDPAAARPLLAEGDALERIRTLKAARQPVYALADWTVHTDRLDPERVAAEVLRAVALLEAEGG